MKAFKRQYYLERFVLTAVVFILSSLVTKAQEYSVDFSNRVQRIKPLNGINLWSKFSRATLDNRQQAAEDCHFSTVRLHDVPWDNEGMRLVDVHQIFGNLNADPSDPNNYFFAPTDDYIANIIRGGSTPIYRLGTSIEHTSKKYFAKKPENIQQYAEICAGIVRHYTTGWANGYEWDIPYWEIWNEPNLVPQMWDDLEWSSYCHFYAVVAKRLHSEFPKIKIGGPALTHWDSHMIGELILTCQQEEAPLDFVSWHCYAQTPAQLLAPPFQARKELDDAGFTNTELHLNEWHYFPTEWNVVHGVHGGDQSKRELAYSPTGLHGAEAAAFICYVLTRWQDGPLDMSNYYAFGLDTWGLIDNFGKLRPSYYAFLLFGEVTSKTPIRVKTHDQGTNISLLGAVSECGTTKLLLVSNYNQDEIDTISISIKGAPQEGEVEIYTIDYEHDYLKTTTQYKDGILTLKLHDSSVFLISF